MNQSKTRDKLRALTDDDLKWLSRQVDAEKHDRNLDEDRGVSISTYEGGAQALSGFFGRSFDKHHGGSCMFGDD